jgi:hypothetical protein
MDHTHRICLAVAYRLVLFGAGVSLMMHRGGIAEFSPLRHRRIGIDDILVVSHRTRRNEENKYYGERTSERR